MSQGYQNTSGYESQVNQGQQQGGEGGGSVTDYEALISQHREALDKQGQELQRVRGEFDGFRKRTEKTESALDRIRRAISGEEEKKEDPRQQRRQRYESDMDLYLSKGLEAEKAGRGIPLTTKAATDFYQYAIEAQEKEAAYEKKIADLERKFNDLSNPDRNLDNQAGIAMEGILQSAMATVYGDTPETQDVRSSQFDATSRLIVNEINNLRKEDPEAWNRIRRDPTAQQKMVSYFVKQVIPPKARELLETQHIRDTPMSENELWAAFKDAKEMYMKNPTDKLENVMSDIRAELLQRSMPGGSRGQGGEQRRGIANRMMSGGY